MWIGSGSDWSLCGDAPPNPDVDIDENPDFLVDQEAYSQSTMRPVWVEKLMSKLQSPATKDAVLFWIPKKQQSTDKLATAVAPVPEALPSATSAPRAHPLNRRRSRSCGDLPLRASPAEQQSRRAWQHSVIVAPLPPREHKKEAKAASAAMSCHSTQRPVRPPPGLKLPNRFTCRAPPGLKTPPPGQTTPNLPPGQTTPNLLTSRPPPGLKPPPGLSSRSHRGRHDWHSLGANGQTSYHRLEADLLAEKVHEADASMWWPDATPEADVPIRFQ